MPRPLGRVARAVWWAVGPLLVLAVLVVLLILVISLDLDRPNRGLINVPDSPLAEERADMDP